IDVATARIEAGVADPADKPAAVNSGARIKNFLRLLEPVHVGGRFGPESERIALPACIDLVIAACADVHGRASMASISFDYTPARGAQTTKNGWPAQESLCLSFFLVRAADSFRWVCGLFSLGAKRSWGRRYAESLRSRSRSHRRDFPAAAASVFSGPCRSGLSRSPRHNPWRAQLHLSGLLYSH